MFVLWSHAFPEDVWIPAELWVPEKMCRLLRRWVLKRHGFLKRHKFLRRRLSKTRTLKRYSFQRRCVIPGRFGFLRCGTPWIFEFWKRSGFLRKNRFPRRCEFLSFELLARCGLRVAKVSLRQATSKFGLNLYLHYYDP